MKVDSPFPSEAFQFNPMVITLGKDPFNFLQIYQV